MPLHRSVRATPAKQPRERVEPVRTNFTRSTGKRLTYTIDADGLGSYTIRLGDKLLKSWQDPLVAHKMGNDWRNPRQARLDAAVASAKADIEALSGMEEE